jgi:hypothetical protein
MADVDASTFTYVGVYAPESDYGRPMIGIVKDKNCIYLGVGKVLNPAGACVNPVSCTVDSLKSNPASCGLK